VKKLSRKQADKYTYRVTWSEEDQEFVGLCAELPSLSWLATSAEEALMGIRKIVTSELRSMERAGEVVPEPLSLKQFSGKFMVRVPPETHRMLSIQAAESGVSLNRFVISKLV
jgi:predicted HicB family RNase H-like nuclease